MTLWSQGCSELVKLLHGCDEVVARLSQAYGNGAGTLQPCHNLVISVRVVTCIILCTFVHLMFRTE